jgi:hypothetical protein
MNTKPSSNRSTIAVIVIIALVGLGYFYYYGSTATPSSSISSTDVNAAVGDQVLNLLNQIKSLNIDTSLFNDAGYLTLRDYSVPIPTLNVGRPNPFAPIPGYTAPAAGASTN